MARILLIDPAEGLRAALTATPALGDHEVVTAAGSVDALRSLRRQCFDVLLTSPRTSVEEDLALLDEVREVRPAVRPIVLAGRATPENVIAAMRAPPPWRRNSPVSATARPTSAKLSVVSGPDSR